MISKKMTVFFLSVFLLVGPGCYTEDPQGLDPVVSGAAPAVAKAEGKWSDGWYQNAEGYDQALEEYKRTNKPMFVYMTVGWCPYCRKFEKEVLSSPLVQEMLKDKIKVSVNPELGQRENALAFQYGIRGFPSLFLHPPQPAGALQFPTGVTPEEFVELFQRSIQ